MTFVRFMPFAAVAMLSLSVGSVRAEEMVLELRYQAESSKDSGRYHRLTRQEKWAPSETAIVVCDMWDLHHCLNAVRREGEFAPRLNSLLNEARSRGVTIIHAPSGCMETYADHPARKRAVETPKAEVLPNDIASWCSRIPAEERGKYPIDQSDGGEDDDPEEHAKWAAELEAKGRNPRAPWKSQIDVITIDGGRDYISDRGEEVWSILEARGIKNVILTGVHTNMCVLGRPFGLRQMAKNGKNVVLMRDMTDTMYNPQRWPYVSHFTGTDLIVSHIEKFVCPTITSDQIIGGKTFRFKNDNRPHLAIVMAEDEYKTETTLPVFAEKYLGKYFRVSFVFGDDKERHRIPGLEVLDEADLALVSIRRRVLPRADMAIVRRFVKAGKPIVGIRTASHAFSLRSNPAPDGLEAWPEFDAQVFGGNYTNHYGNSLKSTVRINADAADHPIMTGLPKEPFPQGGSLYKTSPLVKGSTVLLWGRVDGHEEEPVAWTFKREDGGRSFYTSMGHVADFGNEAFIRQLINGLHWAAGLPMRKDISIASKRADYEERWSLMPVPSSWEAGSAGVLKDYDGVAWYRCAVRIPAAWAQRDRVAVVLKPRGDVIRGWFNGHAMKLADEPGAEDASYLIRPDWISADDANLIALRVHDVEQDGGLRDAPCLLSGASGEHRFSLKGNWQFRIGDDPSWSNMPLPARFGASTDILYEPM